MIIDEVRLKVFSNHFSVATAVHVPASGIWCFNQQSCSICRIFQVDTILPEWIPIWGGERFEFFRPVFNIMDSAITVGVVSILLYDRRFFNTNEKTKDVNEQVVIQD